jgi:hypothetical protein
MLKDFTAQCSRPKQTHVFGKSMPLLRKLMNINGIVYITLQFDRPKNAVYELNFNIWPVHVGSG